MKKFTALLLAAFILLTAVGCAKKEPSAAPATIEGTTAEIIDKIYANHKEVDLYLETLPLDVTDSNAVTYNTGLASGDKLSEGSISEAMMSQAYSLVVLRVKDAADAPQIAKDIYDNVDTRKWICVEADAKTVMYSGDVVVLFMVDSTFDDLATPASMQEAFKTVSGGNMTIVG